MVWYVFLKQGGPVFLKGEGVTYLTSGHAILQCVRTYLKILCKHNLGLIMFFYFRHFQLLLPLDPL